MPNQAVGFGAILTGGVLLTAAITGASVADAITGKASGAKDLGQHSSGSGADASSATAGGASGASSSSGYANPFGGGHPVIGRTDMGVDVSLKPGDPILAIGDATITGIMSNWYSGQPYLWYRLNSGPHAGRYVYVAEQIVPSVKPGDTVSAGDPIGHYAAHGTSLETGWSDASGKTLAQATTGYHEGQVTAAGRSFREFLRGFGL